ncbi:MAG: SMC-Scp complex subunit ScpB [Mycoplasmoidaceae bacterium]|nr:SMC-Scp complex subunit ScpB [Mycoplasmoidaceae bacterium]
MNNYSIIESILYTSGNDGVDINTFKKVLNIPAEEIVKMIDELKDKYANDEKSGFLIKKYGSSFYLLSKEENAEYISKALNYINKNPLTPAMMETLSIIAYNNPATGAMVEKIRGVDSKNAINKLISLGLIKEAGRDTTPGCPYLYKTTQKFLNLFGIKSLSSLPKLKEGTENLIDEMDVDFFNSSRIEDDENI